MRVFWMGSFHRTSLRLRKKGRGWKVRIKGGGRKDPTAYSRLPPSSNSASVDENVFIDLRFRASAVTDSAFARCYPSTIPVLKHYYGVCHIFVDTAEPTSRGGNESVGTRGSSGPARLQRRRMRARSSTAVRRNSLPMDRCGPREHEGVETVACCEVTRRLIPQRKAANLRRATARNTSSVSRSGGRGPLRKQSRTSKKSPNTVAPQRTL